MGNCCYRSADVESVESSPIACREILKVNGGALYVASNVSKGLEENISTGTGYYFFPASNKNMNTKIEGEKAEAMLFVQPTSGNPTSGRDIYFVDAEN
jgi:hypothetical protein